MLTDVATWDEVRRSEAKIRLDRLTDDYPGECDVVLIVVPAGDGAAVEAQHGDTQDIPRTTLYPTD